MFGSRKPSRGAQRRAGRRSAAARSRVAPLRREQPPGSLVRWEARSPTESYPAYRRDAAYGDRPERERPLRYAHPPEGQGSALAHRSMQDARGQHDADSRFNLRRLVADPPGRRRDERSARRSRRDIDLVPMQPRSNSARLSPVRPGTGAIARSSRGGTLQPMPGRSRSAQHPAVQLAPVPRRRPRRRPQKPPSGWVYATRLLILGVGVGAIAGTILSIWNPKGLAPTAASSADEVSADLAQANPTADLMNRLTASTMAVQLGQPLVSAATPLQSLLSQAPDLNAGIFLVDLDTSHFVDVNGATAVAAASTIKIPILVAFLQDVDAGKIRLDEQLTMQQAEVAVGSGDFQDLPVGTQFSALETATKMITISDNTATNMIMTRLGGAEDLNQRFRAWGMTSTVIRNPLADLEGTNTTSARDLSVLLAAVHQGDLLSLRSRDRLFDIMRGTVSSSMLPAGISPEAQIAHKTGTISGMVGDAGIVDLPNGKRYAITVLVERPAGDGRGQELVRQVSSMVYDFFDQPNSPMLVPARELPATEALAPSAPVLESEVRVPEGRSPDM